MRDCHKAATFYRVIYIMVYFRRYTTDHVNCCEVFWPIVKRKKSKNRKQITEFPATLSQHKGVLREITANVGEGFVSQEF